MKLKNCRNCKHLIQKDEYVEVWDDGGEFIPQLRCKKYNYINIDDLDNKCNEWVKYSARKTKNIKKKNNLKNRIETEKLLKISKGLKIIKKYSSYEELKNELSESQINRLRQMIKHFKSQSEEIKHREKFINNFFYCFEDDYDKTKIKEYLEDKRKNNYLIYKSKKVIIYKDDKKIKEFSSRTQAAKFLNITRQTINYHLNNKESCTIKEYTLCEKGDNFNEIR